MRTLFLGGGTGGHLASGIAVADLLRRRGHESVFLVAGRAVERSMLTPGAHAYEALFGDSPRPSVARLRRWMEATSRWRAAVRRHDPDVVVVLGGWVAAPALLTGFFGRPSVLIEQNARAGRVARRLDRRVDHVCLSFAGAEMPRGRRTTQVTGHPSSPMPRLERGTAARRLGLAPDRRTLLLMGGSQGARDLNQLLSPLCTVLETSGDAWQVLHLTGGRTAPDGSPPEAQNSDVPVVALPFLDDMSAAYSLADVAVCRAGAGTVAELSLTGTPSVLVAYPHHADRHQRANAMALVLEGGALLVPGEDPTGSATVPGLLCAALDRLPAMAAAARRTARPDAARQVADVIVRASGAEPRPVRRAVEVPAALVVGVEPSA